MRRCKRNSFTPFDWSEFRSSTFLRLSNCVMVGLSLIIHSQVTVTVLAARFLSAGGLYYRGFKLLSSFHHVAPRCCLANPSSCHISSHPREIATRPSSMQTSSDLVCFWAELSLEACREEWPERISGRGTETDLDCSCIGGALRALVSVLLGLAWDWGLHTLHNSTQCLA